MVSGQHPARNETSGVPARGPFTRCEPVQQAGKSIEGLMSDLTDKNCWSLATPPAATPDKMQRLLERAAGPSRPSRIRGLLWRSICGRDHARDRQAGRAACGHEAPEAADAGGVVHVAADQFRLRPRPDPPVHLGHLAPDPVMAALAICAVNAADLRATSAAPPIPTLAGQQPPMTPA